MEVEVVESVTKTIGSLALVYPYLRRLAVAETVDALTTRGKQRDVPTGQILEVLIVNRLAQRPTPHADQQAGGVGPDPGHRGGLRCVGGRAQ